MNFIGARGPYEARFYELTYVFPGGHMENQRVMTAKEVTVAEGHNEGRLARSAANTIRTGLGREVTAETEDSPFPSSFL